MASEIAEPHDALIDIKPAVVRIKGHNGVTVGAGFLADVGTVITCAHVVEAAIGRPGVTDPPDDQIIMEFAFCKPRQDMSARIVGWSSSELNDVAILEVIGRLPGAARPVHLTTVQDGVFLQHQFYACGFPGGPQGKWIQGVLIAQVDNGWIQLQDNHVTGGRVELGFSGAPVLDKDLNAVIGMVVAKGKNPAEKVGYLIPAQQIYETWNGFPPASRMSVLKVWPRVLDFGAMRPGAIYRARIGISGDSGLHWSSELSGDRRVEVRHDKGGIILIADLQPSAFRASVRVRSNLGEAVTEVTGRRAGQTSVADGIAEAKLALDAASPEAAPYLTEDEARAALREWLAKNSKPVKRSALRRVPKLPDDLFDGPLDLRNASSVQLYASRIREQREEHEVISRRPPPSEYENLALVDPPQLSGGHGVLSGVVWQGVKAGSSRITACGICTGGGYVNCRDCGGAGGSTCADKVTCRRCNGTGVTDRENDQRVCYECQGARVVPCPQCKGFGRIGCQTCQGTGRRTCDGCEGTGNVFQYINGSIRRDITVESDRSDCLPDKADSLRRWGSGYQELILEQEVVSELPERLQRFLTEEMNLPWSAGEVARVAELRVLRAASVTYRYGDHKDTALIFGSHRTADLDITDEARKLLHRIYSASRINKVTERLPGWMPRTRQRRAGD